MTTAAPAITTPAWHAGLPAAVGRGIALFLGAFTLLNILGEWRLPGFDANLWWIDLRPLPSTATHAVLLSAALLWLAYGLRPAMPPWRRLATLYITLAMAGITAANTAVVHRLLAEGAITQVTRTLPVSAWLTGALLVLALAAVWPTSLQYPHRRGLLLGTLLACAIGFPLAQIYSFGWTDYARHADCIVVLGAKVEDDGSCSSALADRVRTACALYQQGYAPILLFSGGPGATLSEPQAMRILALNLRVPPAAILLDENGLDTAATVRNSLPVFRRLGVHRVLVVSHFFHLPRIKMAYGRAGWDVYTVPVRHQQLYQTVPYLVTREVVALWAYYLSPIWTRHPAAATARTAAGRA